MKINLDSLIVRPVKHIEEKNRWNRLIKNYHYLNSHRLVGKSLRYVALVNGKWVALIGWTGPSFKLADREQWLGWCKAHKKQRVKYIANNARLLILPGCHQKNLASKTLALNLKRLADDWADKYHHPVVLVETFVDPSRFNGTCYRAAGFKEIGKTKGYGVDAGDYYYHGQKKLILVRGLKPNTKKLLTAPFLHPFFARGSDKKPLANLNRLNIFAKDGLIERLSTISNWRSNKGRRHDKEIILSLAVCAILAGRASGYREIGRWVDALPWEVASRFGCSYISSYRTPEEHTIRRSLKGVNGKELCQKVALWLKEQGQKRIIPDVCKKLHHFCRMQTKIKNLVPALMGGDLS
ncbi:MAG: Druantia anti-phage system protein DruA [Atribacterota bacterium]